MRFEEVLISSLRFIFNASHNIIIGYRNYHIYARTHRSRALWPQPFVKVQWLGVGEALASKTPSRSWFLGETRVLFISHINSSMVLPLSKCVHFLSIFWVLLGKSACFWALLSRPRPVLPGPQTHPHPPAFWLQKLCCYCLFPPLCLFEFLLFPLFCHCSLVSGGIRSKRVCSTAVVTQKFYNVRWVRVFSITCPKSILIWHVINSIFT